MSDEVRYDAEIIGHHAPFKWKLFRHAPSSSKVSVANCHGEADSFNEAVILASEAAARAHDGWLHTHTTETVVVLRAPVVVEREEDDELLVAEPVRTLNLEPYAQPEKYPEAPPEESDDVPPYPHAPDPADPLAFMD